MLYSIQNSGGKVYGTFNMPPTTKSAEGLAHELKGDLEDILGINGVTDGKFRMGGPDAELQDRVVVDIEAWGCSEDAQVARVQRVHDAVNRLAMMNAVEFDE